MSLLSYLRVEINRIFRSKITWLFILMTVASPLFGLTIFKLNEVKTAATQMIINPVFTGTIGASAFFALFTLFELDKVNKYKTSMLTEAVASVIELHVSRIGAVFAVSVVTSLLTLIVYLPYTAISMQSFFDFILYISSYLVFMTPGMWIGCLFAAVFYQIFRRIDISFVSVAALVLLSFSGFFSGDFILRWINPLIPVYSDAFGNSRPLLMGVYNRLFWIMFLGGAWLLSLLFTRKYGKGIFGSLLHNIKKFYIPVFGAVLIFFSIRHYINEPFYNNAPPEVNWEKMYDTGDNISFSSVNADIKPDFNKGTMKGKIKYTVTNGSLANKKKIQESGYAKKRMIINSGYNVNSITVNGEPVSYTDLGDDNFVTKHIEFEIPKGMSCVIEIEYGGYPKLWGAYNTSLSGSEISRENVALRTSSLIPSLGIYGTPVKVNIVLPDNLTLLSLENAIDSVIDNQDGTKTWTLKNSYDNLDIYASEYACKVVNADTMTAEFYFHNKFSALLEETNVEEVLADVFNYCTEHFGALHYLQDNTLKLIQTTAFDFGGGATSGISNMGETTFSIYSLTDPWKGASSKEILAHEIIHQWWGLNRMIWDDPNDAHWTSEGLTVYTTYRLYKEKYGYEYGKINYVDKWIKAVEEMNRNFYHRHPEYLDIMPEEFAAHIRVRELEVAKYSLMPLKIYKAAELVGGEDAMDIILSELSSSNNGNQLTYQEFLNACGLTGEALEIE